MKKLLLGFALLVFCALFAMAQETLPIEISDTVIDAILSLAFIFGGGFTVESLTEFIKKLIFPNDTTRPKWAGYLSSALVSVAGTAAYLMIFKMFSILGLVLYSLFVFLSANGLYKRKKTATPAP